MEKLQLKHLAPYLPHGLKLKCYNPEFDYNTVTLCDKKGLSNESISNVIDNPDLYKPILRPLSDLTKEIDINGTEITPIKELSREGVLFDEPPISDSYSDYKQWSVWEYEKLIEWHFDIFGLIEKGLAIDINTI